MLPSIEQLLLVQDRDQKLKAFRTELSALPLQKQRIEHAFASGTAALEQLKQRSRDLEVQRRQLELGVKTRQDQAARYRSQQMQTRKNEEFQALGNEIARVERDIVALEDQEIELMEAGEQLQSKVKEAERAYQAAKTQQAEQSTGLQAREQAIQARMAELEADRAS